MKEIFLHPCDVWFGAGDTRLRTVLGSCVAITLWHPILRIGGMCHYMMCCLPNQRKRQADDCYADSAMAAMQAKIRARGHDPREFEAKLFGGGHMFPGVRDVASGIQVQERNIAAGRELVMRYGHPVVAEHLGGLGHRQLVFDIPTGKAWIKHSHAPDGSDHPKELAA